MVYLEMMVKQGSQGKEQPAERFHESRTHMDYYVFVENLDDFWKNVSNTCYQEMQ